jgi:EthD domain-containing protein
MARKEGISSQEFHDHYRHPHGTMGMQITTLRDYVQSHQIDTPLLDDSQRRFECVAELSFDRGADLLTFRTEPTMAGYLNEDELKFLDMKRTRMFVAEEEVLTSHPGEDLCKADLANAHWRLSARPVTTKLLQFVMADGGDGWCSDSDEELGRRLKVFRHVRCHPTEPTRFVASRSSRPPEFIGVRELWWPTYTDLLSSVAADAEAWKLLIMRPGVHNMLVQAERWR